MPAVCPMTDYGFLLHEIMASDRAACCGQMYVTQQPRQWIENDLRDVAPNGNVDCLSNSHCYRWRPTRPTVSANVHSGRTGLNSPFSGGEVRIEMSRGIHLNCGLAEILVRRYEAHTSVDRPRLSGRGSSNHLKSADDGTCSRRANGWSVGQSTYARQD